MLATLTLVVLYLACVDRYPPDDALSGDTAPLSAQFGNDTHHAAARRGVRRSRRAIAWHPPLSAKDVRRVLFRDYSVSTGLADVAALADEWLSGTVRARFRGRCDGDFATPS